MPTPKPDICLFMFTEYKDTNENHLKPCASVYNDTIFAKGGYKKSSKNITSLEKRFWGAIYE